MRLFALLRVNNMRLLLNLTRREKIIFWITVAIVIISLFYNFILVFYLRKVDSLDREIRKLEGRLEKSQHLLIKKGNIEREFKNIKTDETTSVALGEQQIANILIELENIASASMVHISEIKPQAAKKGEYSTEVSVDIRFEGGIKDISKFIYAVEESKELLKIEKLQINTTGDSSFLEGYLEIRKISI